MISSLPYRSRGRPLPRNPKGEGSQVGLQKKKQRAADVVPDDTPPPAERPATLPVPPNLAGVSEGEKGQDGCWKGVAQAGGCGVGGMARRGGTWLTVDSLQGPRQFEPSSGESSGKALWEGCHGEGKGLHFRAVSQIWHFHGRTRCTAKIPSMAAAAAVVVDGSRFFPRQMQGRQRAGRSMGESDDGVGGGGA